MKAVRTPTPVCVPIDPRLRRRRAEVRRVEGRRRVRLVVVGLGTLAVTGGGWASLRSPLLDVDAVAVTGAERTPTASVTAAAAVLGKPMIDVDTAAVRSRVERLPWVAEARIRSDWPGTVRVTITERVPLATAIAAATAPGAPEQWAVVDAHGRVLELTPAPPPDLMILEGPELAGVAGEPGSDLAGAAGAVGIVMSMPPSLVPRVAAVVGAPNGEIELRLRPQGTVRFGPPTDAAAKLHSIETVLARVDTRNLSTLDVRFPESPVLTRG